MKLSYDGVVKSVTQKTAKNNSLYYEIVCLDTVDKKEDKIAFFDEKLFDRLEKLVPETKITVVMNYAYSPGRKSFNLYANDFVEL